MLSQSQRHIRGKLSWIYAAGLFLPFCAFVTAELALGIFEWIETLVLFTVSLAVLVASYPAIGWLLATRSSVNHETKAAAPVLALKKCDGHNLMAALVAGINRTSTIQSRTLSVEEERTYRDPLTGLWNRSGFIKLATDVSASHPCSAVGLMDLDHFQAINDRYGQSVCDDALRFFANRLTGAFRSTDLIARWDGEMFAVLLAGSTLHEGALILQRLRIAMRKEPLVVVGRQSIRFSAGVASLIDDDIHCALRNAEDVLDQAKRAGRDRIEPALFGLG